MAGWAILKAEIDALAARIADDAKALKLPAISSRCGTTCLL